MCDVALARFTPPFQAVTRAEWNQVVVDTWQTEKWFEPLQILINGRIHSIATSLRRRVLTDAGEMDRPAETQIRQLVEKYVWSTWNMNTESVTYRTEWRDTCAQFRSIEACRGWRLLAKRYELEGRPATEVPREEWHIEMLEDLGKNYTEQSELF